MRALLDTHASFWFVFGDPQLSGTAQHVISDPANTPLLSPVSIWETAIKVSTGKLTLGMDVVPFFTGQMAANRIGLLPLDIAHFGPITTLPFHHKDPFDRLLIAQSIVEGVPLVSADTAFDAYAADGLNRIW